MVSEGKHEKKWYRRECVRHEKYESNRAWRGNARHARFEELRLDRLREEEPDHVDLWPKWGTHAWNWQIRPEIYMDLAEFLFEYECAGCVC